MSKRRGQAIDPYAAPGQDAEPATPVGFTGERDAARPHVLRYRYVPRLAPMLAALSFFGACLVFYVWRTATNDRGLIINGLLELERDGATVFFATLAVASAGFVLIGVWAVSTRMRAPSYLVLDEESLSIPSRFRRKARTVPYAAIRDIQLLNVQGQSMLQLATDSDKLTIAAIMLTSDAQLREVGAAIRDRVRRSGRV
jgi:hypothetical protein